MWTFTAYIIARLITDGNNLNDLEKVKNRRISFSTLRYFMFDKLWMKYRLALNDSRAELQSELEYLQDLGIIKIYETDGDLIIEIVNPQLLKDIVYKVEKSPMKSKIRLYNEYLDRINEAINDFKKMN